MKLSRILFILACITINLVGCSNHAQLSGEQHQQTLTAGARASIAVLETPLSTDIPPLSSGITRAAPTIISPTVTEKVTNNAGSYSPESPAPSKAAPTVKATVMATPLACWRTAGKVITASLDTNLLPLPMDYRLYLPPCYTEQPNRRYPMLVLVHGQSSTDDQWDRMGVDETADQLIAQGELSPFIILMPRDRYGGQPTENNFARVVMEELLPQIDREYHTLTERQYRAVGGLSRGAGWAVHLAISHWQDFYRLGAHSPAIFYTDAQQMRTWLDDIPEDLLPLVYIDIGERDRPEILESAYWFVNLLDEKDVPHEWHLFSGNHSEDYWQAHLEQYLRWYAQDW